MNTNPTSHHVTSGNRVIYVTVIRIDPAAVKAVVQTHPYKEDIETSPIIDQVDALQSTQSLPEHITITWFFAAVEAEAPVLSCVVMGASNPVKNTAIGTLEYDWSIKIVHKLCR